MSVPRAFDPLLLGESRTLIEYVLEVSKFFMALQYNQLTGELKLNSIAAGSGYSGHGEGKNNPRRQTVHDVGPIPCGFWEICGPPYISADHGPFVLRLSPLPGTQTFGRSGFLIHGDSRENPGEASMGCIILPHEVRVKIWQSGERRLEVISGT